VTKEDDRGGHHVDVNANELGRLQVLVAADVTSM
jgi:hypothetical protein